MQPTAFEIAASRPPAQIGPYNPDFQRFTRAKSHTLTGVDTALRPGMALLRRWRAVLCEAIVLTTALVAATPVHGQTVNPTTAEFNALAGSQRHAFDRPGRGDAVRPRVLQRGGWEPVSNQFARQTDAGDRRFHSRAALERPDLFPITRYRLRGESGGGRTGRDRTKHCLEHFFIHTAVRLCSCADHAVGRRRWWLGVVDGDDGRRLRLDGIEQRHLADHLERQFRDR